MPFNQDRRDGGFSANGRQHILIANKTSDCNECEDGIEAGQQIMRNYGGWAHLWCMPRWKYAFAQAALNRYRK